MVELNLERVLKQLAPETPVTEQSLGISGRRISVSKNAIAQRTVVVQQAPSIPTTYETVATPSPVSNKSPRTNWIQNFFARPFALREVRGLIAQIETLPDLRESGVRLFMDDSLPRLMELSLRYPQPVHRMLESARVASQQLPKTEPWYRLVQVACGDAHAILPALETLC